MRTNIVRSILLALLVVGCPAGAASAAESATHTVLEDAKLYFTAPLRWQAHDWAWFGGTLVGLAIAHEYDDNVRAHFTDPYEPLDGDDSHDLEDALPAAALFAGTLVYSALTKNAAGYQEAGSMLEASALSAVTVVGLKFAAGRLRPNETTDVDEWGEGGDAFPSMHTTLAFAIGTVFAESGSDDGRWGRRIVGYGVASATAYLRVRHNAHWLSDTVAGAALGVATARFVVNRRSASTSAVRGIWQVEPLADGLMLGYSVALR